MTDNSFHKNHLPLDQIELAGEHLSAEAYAEKSFSGLKRLYGKNALQVFTNSHIVVIGIGGVGSWAVESLARTAIGEITLIDLDNVSISNINRQLPANADTIGMAKVSVMKDRIISINPFCKVNLIEDFINADNINQYLGKSTQSPISFVIDCIDQVNEKAALAAYCKRHKLNIIVTGGAGGKTDITRIKQSDLAKSYHDPLLAKMRQKLKQQHNIVLNNKKRLDIPCVFCDEQSSFYHSSTDTISQQKPKDTSTSGLNCHHGMGSLMAMTASIGLATTSFVFKKLISQANQQTSSS